MSRSSLRPVQSTFVTIGIFLAALVLVVTLGHSQSPAGERVKIQSDMPDAAVRLQLEPDQEVRFQELVTDFRTSIRTTMELHGIDPTKGQPSWRAIRAVRHDVSALRSQLEAEMSDILTPEQMKEFKVIQRERRHDLRAQLPGRL